MFRYYMKSSEGDTVTPVKIDLPSGMIIEFDEKTGKINFEPCRRYIGRLLSVYKDGELLHRKILLDVKPNKDGVNALWFGDEPTTIDLSVIK